MAVMRAVRLVWTIATMAALLALGSMAMAAPDAAMYAKCAKACGDCYSACKTCTTHCEGMVKAGMKQHVTSAKISADCRDLCDVAAKLTGRKGPMTVAACR